MFWKRWSERTAQTEISRFDAMAKTVRVALQIRHTGELTVTQDEMIRLLLPIFRTQARQPNSISGFGTDDCISVEYILDREQRTGFCLECAIEDEIRSPVRNDLKNAGFMISETRIEVS